MTQVPGDSSPHIRRRQNLRYLFVISFRLSLPIYVTFRGVMVFCTTPYGDYRNTFVFPYGLSSYISWLMFYTYYSSYAAPLPPRVSVPFLLSIFHL